MRVSLTVAVVLFVIVAGCGSPDAGQQSPTTPADGSPSGPTTSAVGTTPSGPGTPSTTRVPTTPPTSTSTTPPTPTTEGPATTEPEPPATAGFPTPEGAQATYAPEPSPPVSNSTRIQVFDAPLSPPNATDWYRTELTDWTLHVDVPSYTGEWGWMNRLVFTKGDEILFVYITTASDHTTSEITLARGTERVGAAGSVYFGDLGWEPTTYTTSPVDPDTVDGVAPLGNLAPPSHTFPTDHAYLFIPEEHRPVKTVAPADGVVTEIWVRSSDGDEIDDYAVTIAHSNVHVTQFQHLSGLDPALVAKTGPLEAGENEVSIPVAAGDPIGTAPMSKSTALDWFVYDYTRQLDGFAHPEYYGKGAYTHHFLAYASPDLRATYEPKLIRDEAPRYGTIDYDEPGRLVGNWFLETDPVMHGTRAGHLAFVYSVRDPDRLRVSVGGTVISPGQYAVDGNRPDPATITSDDGPVVYHLRYAHGSGQVEPDVTATLLVEVIGPNRIRVQGWDYRVTNPSFTDDAKTYVR